VSPVRASERHRYPADWREISARIRFGRAAGQCECTGECGTGHAGRCEAEHGQAHPVTGSRVVLTTAHLDHRPENCADANLRAMCQRCHLAYDVGLHKASAAATRAARRPGQLVLFTAADLERITGRLDQLADLADLMTTPPRPPGQDDNTTIEQETAP
jgi:hypothetical protein